MMSGRARRAALRRLASPWLTVAVTAAALGLAAGAPSALATPLSADIDGELVVNWPSGIVDPGIDGFSFAMIAKIPEEGGRLLFANVAENDSWTTLAEVDDADTFAFWHHGSRAGSLTEQGTPGNWYMIGVSVAGDEQPRIHVKDLDTNTWILVDEQMDHTFCCNFVEELTSVVYGAGGPTLIAAQWDEALSPAEMENLGNGLSFSTWLDTARSDMILGHRFNTTLLNDFSGNDASEVSRTNVSLVADAPTDWVDDIPNPCPSDPFAAAQTSTADTVYEWNDVLLGIIRLEGGAPAPHARAAAMLNVSIYDTFNSVFFAKLEELKTGTPTTEVCGWQKYELLAEADPDTDADLAAGYAAKSVLTSLYPARATSIANSFNAIHDTPALDQEAKDLGDLIAGAVIAARTGDGSEVTTPYVWDSVTPGAWRPTQDVGCTDPATPSTSPATPNWGNVTPFTLTDGDQFRQPLPGGYSSYATLLASTLYTDNFIEVKAYGAANSVSRTEGQKDLAWFWANDLDGTYKPPGQMLQHTFEVATTQANAEVSGEPWTFFRRWSQQGIRVARLYTEISLAMADAAIAAWDAKYYTSIDLWRPVTAIQQALSDGNTATHEDLGWQPLSATAAGVHFTPCFPAWVSGHATFGGAWAQVMKNEFAGADFDDPFPLILTTEDPHSVMENKLSRAFFTFDHAAEENAVSRIYLGVHFRFDAQAGLATGRSVGNHVTGNHLRPIQTCENWDCED